MTPFDRSQSHSNSGFIFHCNGGRIFYRFRNKDRYICRQTPVFQPPPFNLHDHLAPSNLQTFFEKNLIQTAQVPELLGSAKMLLQSSNVNVNLYSASSPKAPLMRSNSVGRVHERHWRRQTDGSCVHAIRRT